MLRKGPFTSGPPLTMIIKEKETELMPSLFLDLTGGNRMNITKMLHQVIDLELTVDDAQELTIGPRVRQQTIFTALDVELAKLADSAGWYKVLSSPRPHQEDLLNHYVTAMELLLLYSAKRQWTHLVVIDEAAMDRITGADQATKLADLNKEYLAIKHFLQGGFYSNRQDDFRHAWHLLLKMGLVDFKLSDQEIMDAYDRQIKVQQKQWTD